MNKHELVSIWQSDQPPVYCMTDRDLADEYSRLTGGLVQVPSRRNAEAWWRWRSELQKKLIKARSSRQPWYLTL